MATNTNTKTTIPSDPHPLIRWYIDTRPLTATTTSLPLLSTLQAPDQISVQKYYHLKDKHMSLASNLLKYLFIHRTCCIPWSSIVISRTPDPHRRPIFIPDDSSFRDNIPAIEFNVSHQASLVAIAGTKISADVTSGRKPEVGIDITCVNERQNRSKSGEGRSLQSLRDYVDIFTDVFSSSEIADMKGLRGAPASLKSNQDPSELVEYGYRLFYTYWALKEAYIKMTGEALLAPWLRELEFTNVIAPPAVEVGVENQGQGQFGEPYRGVTTSLYGEAVEDVRIEVVALEGNYLIATAGRGEGVGPRPQGESGDDKDFDSWIPFAKLDIERDIRPCATGVCGCLS